VKAQVILSETTAVQTEMSLKQSGDGEDPIINCGPSRNSRSLA